MYYKLYADGTIQGSAGVPQDGWQELPECPYEHGRWDGKKWHELPDPQKEALEREALMRAEIRNMAIERLKASGKL